MNASPITNQPQRRTHTLELEAKISVNGGYTGPIGLNRQFDWLR
jgi:hypothetical protein